jgi:hypothetical protein
MLGSNAKVLPPNYILWINPKASKAMTKIHAHSQRSLRRGTVVAPASLGLVVGLAAVATTAALNWPLTLRLSAAGVAFLLVVGMTTIRLWGPWLYKSLSSRAPRAAQLFWHICLNKHDDKLKHRVLTACGIAVGASLLLYAVWPEARQWALVGITLSGGAILGYLGMKCCRNKDGKGRVWVAIAGYLLSLSANYLADATARDETAKTLDGIDALLQRTYYEVVKGKEEATKAKEEATRAKEEATKAKEESAKANQTLGELGKTISAKIALRSTGNLNKWAPPANKFLSSRTKFRMDLLNWAKAPGDVKALAIVGAPGVNTTDIARGLADALDPVNPGTSTPYREIWWLQASTSETVAPTAALASNLSRLLQDLGQLPDKEADVDDLARAVRAALAGRDASLFVINGLTDPALLPKLLPHGACTALVTTTRKDLPLQMIQSWDVPRLSTEESFAVLASRRPDLRGAANDPALRQIVEAADGDDFALELCIAYFARPSNPAPSELASALCGGTSSKSHPFFDSNLRGGLCIERVVGGSA